MKIKIVSYAIYNIPLWYHFPALYLAGNNVYAINWEAPKADDQLFFIVWDSQRSSRVQKNLLLLSSNVMK